VSELCDEVYELREVRIRKARKSHVCCACKTAIAPGDYYANVFTLFDGETTIYKRCGACQLTHEHLIDKCTSLDDSEMWPREDLGCGLRYESEWGAVPDEIAALAFVSPEERGKLLHQQPAKE
jgi:hypothetical protein